MKTAVRKMKICCTLSTQATQPASLTYSFLSRLYALTMDASMEQGLYASTMAAKVVEGLSASTIATTVAE